MLFIFSIIVFINYGRLLLNIPTNNITYPGAILKNYLSLLETVLNHVDRVIVQEQVQEAFLAQWNCVMI